MPTTVNTSGHSGHSSGPHSGSQHAPSMSFDASSNPNNISQHSNPVNTSHQSHMSADAAATAGSGGAGGSTGTGAPEGKVGLTIVTDQLEDAPDPRATYDTAANKHVRHLSADGYQVKGGKVPMTTPQTADGVMHRRDRGASAAELKKSPPGLGMSMNAGDVGTEDGSKSSTEQA